jgi:hypothetical protein
MKYRNMPPPQWFWSRIYHASIVGITTVCMFGVAFRSWCDDSPPRNPDTKSRILRLLRELDADQRSRRVHAERELLDLGPSILNDLPPPELIANPAVRASVTKIRKSLELRKATESIQPTTVTTPSGISFADFVQQIEAQTANHLDVKLLTSAQLERLVPKPFQGETFWNALDLSLGGSGVVADYNPDSTALRLVPLNQEKQTLPNPLAISRTGPYRVVLESLKLRDIAGSNQKRLRAELSVAPEPRLRALFLKFAAKDFYATTNNGQVLPSADPDAQLDLPLGEGGHYVRWNLDFLVPADFPPTELQAPRISGSATMQIAAGSEHIRIRDLTDSEGIARRRGGVTVTVLKVKVRELPPGKRDLSIQIQVAYDTGGPAFESHRTWIFHNQVYLDPLEGDPIRADGGYETNLQSNGVVGVTYRFTGVSAPLNQLQFVYVAPTLIVDSPLKFELAPGKQ